MIKLNEIYIFDENLNHISTIDDFENVVWEENFFEADTVSIEYNYKVVTDTTNPDYHKNKNIFDSLDSMFVNNIYKPRFVAIDFFGSHRDTDVKENIRLCNIETYSIDESKKILKIEGRGFLSIFDFKYAYDKEYIPKPDVEDFAGMVASRVLTEHAYPDPVLNKIFIADENSNKVGPEVYFATESGQGVYEAVTELLTTFNLGFETILNYNDKKIYFNVINPEGRRIDLAISKDDDNLINNEFEFDINNYRNYISIEGAYKDEGAEDARLVVEIIDNSQGNIKLSMTASSNKKQGSMTELEYREVLKTEAIIELEKNVSEEHFDIEISNDVNVKLGDTAIVKIEAGYKELIKEILITSIKHDFTKSEYKRKVGFGKPYNARNQLKKTLGVK